MELCFKKKFYCTIFIFLFHSGILAAIGQSAVITLSFPFGARSTGMGETFTGVANNVDATFYNPAGLGQSPLSNTWKAHYPLPDANFTAIASKHKRGFGKKEKIWLGTGKNGVFRFNGKVWDSYDTYIIQENDNLRHIAEKFLNVDNKELIDNAIKIIKEKSNIEGKRLNEIKKIIEPYLLDTIPNKRNAAINDISSQILNLDKLNQNATQIYGIIASKIDSTNADSLADKLVEIFSINDVLFSDLVELKIPFSIAIQDSVTALELDPSERVWIGTVKGLWRYDGSSWNHYTILNGLPSNYITSLSINHKHDIAVGTNNGIALFSGGEWKSFGLQEGLPDSAITSVTFGEGDILYAGTASGIAKKKDDVWTVFDTSDGLLSNEVAALFFDSNNKLWIGSKEGVTIYDEISWKRYKFPESHVYCIAEYRPGKIWLGTDKGAISYHAGRVKTDNNGNKIQESPKWKAFHSKNALKGNKVMDITIHDKDIWLITEEAVNQYDHGELQFTVFYEPLLPAFKIPDLWHATLAGVFPTEEWGTIGFYLNYLNFGENEQVNELGVTMGKFHSYEYVLSLCYGLSIKQNLSFGLNVKYAHSALAPGIGEDENEGVGRTFAIDASILKRDLFIKNLSLGFSILNMGPPVFYISVDEADPIPFTLRLGLAYTILQTPVHNLLVAVDFDREIVNNENYQKPDPFWKAIGTGLLADTTETWKDELKEVIAHVGIEYWYVYFLALRMGFMYDEAGERYELSLGLGLKYDRMNVDWSYINSLALGDSDSEARDGQWRFSFTLTP